MPQNGIPLFFLSFGPLKNVNGNVLLCRAGAGHTLPNPAINILHCCSDHMVRMSRSFWQSLLEWRLLESPLFSVQWLIELLGPQSIFARNYPLSWWAAAGLSCVLRGPILQADSSRADSSTGGASPHPQSSWVSPVASGESIQSIFPMRVLHIFICHRRGRKERNGLLPWQKNLSQEREPTCRIFW